MSVSKPKGIKRTSDSSSPRVPRWEQEKVQNLIGLAGMLSPISLQFVLCRIQGMSSALGPKGPVATQNPTTPVKEPVESSTAQPSARKNAKLNVWDLPTYDRFPSAVWLRSSTKEDRSSDEGKEHLKMLSKASALVSRAGKYDIPFGWFTKRWHHFANPTAFLPKDCDPDVVKAFKALPELDDEVLPELNLSSSSPIPVEDLSVSRSTSKKRDRTISSATNPEEYSSSYSVLPINDIHLRDVDLPKDKKKHKKEKKQEESS